MTVKLNSLAWRLWRHNIAAVLIFQWVLLCLVVGVAALISDPLALNVLLAGLSIIVPYTLLGLWLGIRVLFNKNNSHAIFIGSAIKIILNIVLMALAMIFLKDNGWVWQGFFLGLVSMLCSPVLFGLYRNN